MTALVAPILQPYQERISFLINELIASLGPKTSLRDACEYAMKGNGKKIRPALVFMLAEANGNRWDAGCAALTVELLHAASLIADDLPCMDDDEVRRDRATLHKVFGEGVGLLTTYALIAAAYEQLSVGCQQFEKERPELISAAFQQVSRSIGIHGTTGGQYLDLYGSQYTQEILLSIRQKTGALFESSFVLGWLFGGGDLSLLPLIRQTAQRFGMIFQLVDDFADKTSDRKRGVKNAFIALGESAALLYLKKEMEQIVQDFKELGLSHSPLLQLSSALSANPLAAYESHAL